MAKPNGLRSAEEVVPRLGVRQGLPVLRIGEIATYDRPLEHLAGQLDHVKLTLPLPVRASRYGVVLAFVLAPVDLARLGRELMRVTHPEGRQWVVVWKNAHLQGGAPSWDEMHRALLRTQTQWVDNKILSLGSEIYATQFVRRLPGHGTP